MLQSFPTSRAKVSQQTASAEAKITTSSCSIHYRQSSSSGVFQFPIVNAFAFRIFLGPPFVRPAPEPAIVTTQISGRRTPGQFPYCVKALEPFQRPVCLPERQNAAGRRGRQDVLAEQFADHRLGTLVRSFGAAASNHAARRSISTMERIEESTTPTSAMQIDLG